MGRAGRPGVGSAASWARLGSDGSWAEYVGDVAPFQPANMGFLVDWSEHMAKHFGEPVKDVALIAGDQVERGEFVISARGVEGGGIYAVSRALREGAELRVDLLPHLSVDEVRKRLARGKAKDSLAKQRERERSDSLSFDDFLADYFGTSKTPA